VPTPIDFPGDDVFYRVLGGAPGYLYRPGEAEEMEGPPGSRTAAEPYFEFDPIEDIGRWLTLGHRVRRLRVPTDADVERNSPLSQGGCYRWSASKVELLDVIDIKELARQMALSGRQISSFYVERYEFGPTFSFPPKLQYLSIRECLATTPLVFPTVLYSLDVHDSALCVKSFPSEVKALALSRSLFEGTATLPSNCKVRHIDDCDFTPSA
jgi:hypothetical protein